MKYKAFLFELNGTMINDRLYHIKAWYRILNEPGADITMERVKKECYVKNWELIERIFPGWFSEEEKNQDEHRKSETIPKRIQTTSSIDQWT
jgi:beta-phosphoglucomutase